MPTNWLPKILFSLGLILIATGGLFWFLDCPPVFVSQTVYQFTSAKINEEILINFPIINKTAETLRIVGLNFC